MSCLGGRRVCALGLGTLPLGVTYSGASSSSSSRGEGAVGGRPSRAQALGVLKAALDEGIRFFDTGDVSVLRLRREADKQARY